MSCFLLPLLRPRLEAWLADDHARTLLLGICKQAWSGNQLRFRNLQTLWTAFLRRGIRPVVTGAAASALLTAEQEILPITSFELMVPLDDVAPALEESKLLGWMPVSALPESLEQLWRSLSWVRMSRSGSERMDSPLAMLFECAGSGQRSRGDADPARGRDLDGDRIHYTGSRVAFGGDSGRATPRAAGRVFLRGVPCCAPRPVPAPNVEAVFMGRLQIVERTAQEKENVRQPVAIPPHPLERPVVYSTSVASH